MAPVSQPEGGFCWPEQPAVSWALHNCLRGCPAPSSSPPSSSSSSSPGAGGGGAGGGPRRNLYDFAWNHSTNLGDLYALNEGLLEDAGEPLAHPELLEIACYDAPLPPQALGANLHPHLLLPTKINDIVGLIYKPCFTLEP